MSLESLNALRQLVQVEQQGEASQKENLDQVQQAVQSQGTSEAQRTDQVSLELAKAEYDAALQSARIQTIESKLMREQNALTVSGIVAIGVTAFSAGDAISSVIKDMGGGNISLTSNKDQSGLRFGDSGQSDRSRDIDPNNVRHTTSGKAGTSATDHYFIGDNPDGSQTVQRAKQNSNGSINDDIRSATISENDVEGFLTQKKGENNSFALVDSDGKATDRAKLLGLSDNNGNFTQKAQDLGLGNKGEGFNIDKINNFEDLQKLDDLDPNRKASEALFDKKSHSIKKSEVDGFMGIIEKTGALNQNLVNDALASSGKAPVGAWDRVGDFAKSSLNEVIRMADTTMPFIQAWLSMKSKVEETSIELEAAKEKLAAALKKIAELKKMITNAGVDTNTENTGAVSVGL